MGDRVPLVGDPEVFADAEPQARVPGGLAPGADDVDSRAHGGRVPAVVTGIPEVEVVVVDPHRHEVPRARGLVEADQMGRVEPLRLPEGDRVLESELRRVPVVLEVIFVLVGALQCTCSGRTSRPPRRPTGAPSGPTSRTWRRGTIPAPGTARGTRGFPRRAPSLGARFPGACSDPGPMAVSSARAVPRSPRAGIAPAMRPSAVRPGDLHGTSGSRLQPEEHHVVGVHHRRVGVARPRRPALPPRRRSRRSTAR